MSRELIDGYMGPANIQAEYATVFLQPHVMIMMMMMMTNRRKPDVNIFGFVSFPQSSAEHL